MGFSLPCKITCPGAGECKKYCYSNKSERLYPRVLKCRYRNLELTKKGSFVRTMDRIIEEKVDNGLSKFRLHVDGDFYNQKYLDNWTQILYSFPKLKVVSFTKSFHLNWDDIPDNMIYIQSSGSKWDHLINKRLNTARVIENPDLTAKSEYLCPYNNSSSFTKCGISCNYCFTKGKKHVAFLKH